MSEKYLPYTFKGILIIEWGIYDNIFHPFKQKGLANETFARPFNI